MSIAAAIGYAIGIIIFAWVIRRNRGRMIDKHIARNTARQLDSDKGQKHD